MPEQKKLNSWNDQYWNQIKRNIGLITVAEQEKLRNAKIVIFGVGGLGGPIVSNLARSGCEKMVICDNDKFTASNLNRQMCTIKDIGVFKVDFLQKHAKEINPNIDIEKYYQINEDNIHSILKDVDLAVLSLDDALVSILISRVCLEQKIPLLESWGVPYLCAWYFTPESVNYESCYGLNTTNLTIAEIQNSLILQKQIKSKILNKLTQFPGIRRRYDREPGILEGLLKGNLSSISLAPIIRLSASYLTFEVIMSGILKIKPMILAPNIIGYDYFEMKPINFRIS